MSEAERKEELERKLLERTATEAEAEEYFALKAKLAAGKDGENE